MQTSGNQRNGFLPLGQTRETPTQITRFVVVGCGHTGTTLLSGIMKSNGFGSLGELSKTCESKALNRLNELLYEREITPRLRYAIDDFLEQLEAHTKGKWCLKDPLFSYTLPLIYPRIRHPVRLLFNFRHPGSTVEHLRRDRMKNGYLTSSEALRHLSSEKEWVAKTEAVLGFISAHPELEYLLVDYDDLVDGKIRQVLEAFVGSRLCFGFVNPSKRKSPKVEVSQHLLDIYSTLRNRIEENHSRFQLTSIPNIPILFSRSFLHFARHTILSTICSLMPMVVYRMLFPAFIIRFSKSPFPFHWAWIEAITRKGFPEDGHKNP